MTKPVRMEFQNYEEFLTFRAQVDRLKTVLNVNSYGEVLKEAVNIIFKEEEEGEI